MLSAAAWWRMGTVPPSLAWPQLLELPSQQDESALTLALTGWLSISFLCKLTPSGN